MKIRERKLKSRKIPIRILKKFSTKIEKDGKLTEEIKDLSQDKNK